MFQIDTESCKELSTPSVIKKGNYFVSVHKSQDAIQPAVFIRSKFLIVTRICWECTWTTEQLKNSSSIQILRSVSSQDTTSSYLLSILQRNMISAYTSETDFNFLSANKRNLISEGWIQQKNNLKLWKVETFKTSLNNSIFTTIAHDMTISTKYLGHKS